MKNNNQPTTPLRATEKQVAAIERMLENELLDDVTVAELRSSVNGDLTRLGASLLIDLLASMLRWVEWRAEINARSETSAAAPSKGGILAAGGGRR